MATKKKCPNSQSCGMSCIPFTKTCHKTFDNKVSNALTKKQAEKVFQKADERTLDILIDLEDGMSKEEVSKLRKRYYKLAEQAALMVSNALGKDAAMKFLNDKKDEFEKTIKMYS